MITRTSALTKHPSKPYMSSCTSSYDLPDPTIATSTRQTMSTPPVTPSKHIKKRTIAETIDLTHPPVTKRQRKSTSDTPTKKTSTTTKTPTRKKKGDSNDGEGRHDDKPEEKRLKRFRPKCPSNVSDRLVRAQEQRMYVLGRRRDDQGNVPNEIFDVAGTTGNVYKVRIGLVPECTCPDFGKNHTCKHILYVMMKALKARSDLVYQAALLSTELQEIFDKAAPPSDGKTNDNNGKRKPLGDDCPICYETCDDDASTVFCRAQCGTNIHKACFRQWAASKGAGNVTCVMCRTKWEENSKDVDTSNALANAEIGEEGYLNVAKQLGLGQTRDHSSYHGFGMYRKYGYGKRY